MHAPYIRIKGFDLQGRPCGVAPHTGYYYTLTSALRLLKTLTYAIVGKALAPFTAGI